MCEIANQSESFTATLTVIVPNPQACFLECDKLAHTKPPMHVPDSKPNPLGPKSNNMQVLSCRGTCHCCIGSSNNVVCSTKQKSNQVACLQSSLERLQQPSVDLYQIHWPGFPILNAWANDAFCRGLVKCHQQGLAKAVGVSNYNIKRMQRAHSIMAVSTCIQHQTM